MRTVFACVTALLLAASTVRAENALYRCSAKTVLDTKDDGTLAPYGNNFWTDYWTDVLIDTATAVVRRGKAQPERWVVVQKGSATNDFVAVIEPTLVSATNDVLRVRAWAEKQQVTFLYYSFSHVVSGTCTVVR